MNRKKQKRYTSHDNELLQSSLAGRPESMCFVHRSQKSGTVFTPTQMSNTNGINSPGYESAALNQAGVDKTSKESGEYTICEGTG